MILNTPMYPSTSVQYGTHANAPPAPKVGDMYVATDRAMFMICINVGLWDRYTPLSAGIEPGSGVIHSNAVERNVSSSGYVLVKESTWNGGAEEVTIAASHKTSATAYGCILSLRKNGVEFANNNTSSETYVIVETDVVLAPGDVITAYLGGSTSATQYVKDLEFRGQHSQEIVRPVTDNDP